MSEVQPLADASASEDAGDREPLLTPQQAADALGLKPAMMRRYAETFEAVTGRAMFRDGHGRLFTGEQVGQLKLARMQTRSRGLSVEAALREVLGLQEAPPAALGPRDDQAILDALTRLQAALEVQSGMLLAQRQELTRLRDQLAHMQALPAPAAEPAPLPLAAPAQDGGTPRPRGLLARLLGQK